VFELRALCGVFPFPLQLKCKVILPVSDITGLFYYVPQA